MSTGARQALAQQGHYAGALSRLLAYGADLLIVNTVYAIALAILEFAINTATPWNVELKESYILVVIGGAGLVRVLPGCLMGRLRALTGDVPARAEDRPRRRGNP